jgi:transcriptional regulator with XRE-family HTH domain
MYNNAGHATRNWCMNCPSLDVSARFQEERSLPSAISKKERRLPIASVAEPATELAQVGQRLRRLRVARGISLRELARTIKVSPSLISHIELGKGAPSVKTLYALIAAFGISMSEVFQDDSANGSRQISSNGSFVGAPGQALGVAEDKTSQSNKFVQRASTRRAIQLEHGFRWECLTPGSDPDVEFMETIIAVGGGRPDSEMKSHNGTEYGIVLQGKLGIKIAFDTYILEPRDSIRFESNLPHCMWNAGNEPVRSIWFVRGRSV